MMISPEKYYETELKGKSAEDIAKKIRGLKNEIGHLKKTIESPDYKPIIRPDERTRLWCSRRYLERAIIAYEEAGGIYQPSKAEQTAAAFDAAIPTIIKIIFTIGGFFGGYETCTITLAEDNLQLYVKHPFNRTPTNFDIEPDYPMTKEEFLEELRDIHIGEWHRHYYDRDVLDGTQWELTIEYADGRKIEYNGSNAYPFSFDKFRELVATTKKREMKRMTDRFAELTAFIPQIKDDAFGEWIIDREDNGSSKPPKQMPFVNYSRIVHEFIETLGRYCEAHPEFEHTRYGDTLESIGLKWDSKSMEEADVSRMDARGVIALLTGAVRAERFCDGALLVFFKNGCILRWLERLADIDNQ